MTAPRNRRDDLVAFWSKTDARARDIHEVYRRSRTEAEEEDRPSSPFTNLSPGQKRLYRAVARWVLSTIKEKP